MGSFELRAVSFLQNCLWADGGFKGAQESAMLVVTPKPSSNEEKNTPTVSRGNDAGYVVIYPNGTVPGLFRPRIVPESFDSERTRKWLQNCRDCHGSECRGLSQTVAAMKLIDCETLEVIPATASMTMGYIELRLGNTESSCVQQSSITPFTPTPITYSAVDQ
ncbi:hypothetical protein FNYG_09576 [Fusarium nygamai]|uniref:Uncharacterized protein n=1 Tax=Gibberella nygamai TaxID=42673 RepID=A0A2K0W3W1_GIBNY|nr:hypothetical protein FNYG_09576 [Fusarium nygamai]